MSMYFLWLLCACASVSAQPRGDNDARFLHECCVQRSTNQPGCTQQACAAAYPGTLLNAYNAGKISLDSRHVTPAQRQFDTGKGESQLWYDLARGNYRPVQQVAPQQGLIRTLSVSTDRKRQADGQASLSEISTPRRDSRLSLRLDNNKARRLDFDAPVTKVGLFLETSARASTSNPHAPWPWADGFVYYDFTTPIPVLPADPGTAAPAGPPAAVAAWPALKAAYDQAVVQRQEATELRTKSIAAMNLYEAGTCLYFEERTGQGMPTTAHFFKSTDGSSTNCLGFASAFQMTLQLSRDSDVGTAAHEIGHLVGLQHTHVRSDRNAHVVYDRGTCVQAMITGSLAHYCGGTPKLAHLNRCRGNLPAKPVGAAAPVVPPVPAASASKPERDAYAAALANNQAWTTQYQAWTQARDALVLALQPDVVVAPTYDPTVLAQVEACGQTLCANEWQKQYDPESNYQIAPATYDFGSIMHYRFDDCMTGKTAAQGGDWNPGVSPAPQSSNGPTALDLEGLRTIYSCFAITVEMTGHAPLTVYASPGWTGQIIKRAAAKRWGLRQADVVALTMVTTAGAHVILDTYQVKTGLVQLITDNTALRIRTAAEQLAINP